MNELQVFNFESDEVRTTLIDGEPWFVARDVCSVLGISNVSLVVNGRERRREDGTRYWSGGLDSDEKGVVSVNTLGGVQGMLCVSESGLYSLIFQSTRDEAKQFKRWITHEVIPSIRNTGSYQQPKSQAELALMMAQQLVEQEKRIEANTKSIQTIQETFIQRDPDWRKHINSLIKGAAFRTNGDYRAIRNKSYQMLEERGHCDLSKRLRNLVQRLEDSGATKTDIDKANKMDVIEQDPKLKEIYASIVKELSIGSMKVATY